MPHRRYTSILITGASSGIGAALAAEYAAPDVFLALSGRNEDRLEEIADLCRQKGAEVASNIIDVTDQQGMEDWINEMDDHKSLDLVIANAGVSADTSGVQETADRAAKVLEINVQGVLNTILPIPPRMQERQSGQVALMSSLAGFRGLSSGPAYSASKAWVKSYAEGLRGRYGRDNVGVSVICPGFVKSRITDFNSYKMPFFMDAPKAAGIITKGLSRNRSRIAFPFPMHFLVWLMQAMPPSWSDRLLSDLPLKE